MATQLKIMVVEGDLSKFSADVIVNAADVSLGMTGGVAAALRKAGGKDIEEEALESAPLEIGQAIATTAGKLDAKFVIHAASMKLGQKAMPENVRTAFLNALELADSLECQHLGVPAIGCGAGGLTPQESARVMFEAARGFSPSVLTGIIFVLNSNDVFLVFVQTARELGIELFDFSAFEKQLKNEDLELERLREERETEREEKTADAVSAVEEQKTRESDS